MIITVILFVLLLGSLIYMVLVDPDGQSKTSEMSLERRAQILRGLREKRKRRNKK